MTDRVLISLTVNGTEHEVLCEARRTLSDVLRHELLLPAHTSHASTACAGHAPCSSMVLRRGPV